MTGRRRWNGTCGWGGDRAGWPGGAGRRPPRAGAVQKGARRAGLNTCLAVRGQYVPVRCWAHAPAVSVRRFPYIPGVPTRVSRQGDQAQTKGGVCWAQKRAQRTSFANDAMQPLL